MKSSVKELFIFSFIFCVFFLVGCTADKTGEDIWNESPTFNYNDKKIYGVEGEIGIERVNGEENEPDFPVTQGRLYNIHFFGVEKKLFGEEAVITAFHQDTAETIELYRVPVSDTSQAKLAFEEEGLWKIIVTINGEPYSSFIVLAEKL